MICLDVDFSYLSYFIFYELPRSIVFVINFEKFSEIITSSFSSTISFFSFRYSNYTYVISLKVVPISNVLASFFPFFFSALQFG